MAVVLILRRFNPVEYQLFPPCMFHRLTGLNCPGCGLQRFVHAMTNGRPVEAIAYNAYLPLVFLYIALFALERLVLTGTAQQRLRHIIEGRPMLIAFIVSIPLWTVVRNILGI